MSKQKGTDYSRIIILASVLVGMVRYSAAFLSSDLGEITGALSETVTILLGVSGFAMGILGTLGAAYLFDGWRQKMPAAGAKWGSKFKALTLFVFSIFLTETVILVPFTMSRVLHVSVADVLQGGVWWWSTAVVVMPLLLIGGVSVGNQIVTVSQGGNLPETYRQKSEGIPKNWKQARKVLSEDQVRGIAVDQTKNIAFHYGLDERTARNWRVYAQEEIAKKG